MKKLSLNSLSLSESSILSTNEKKALFGGVTIICCPNGACFVVEESEDYPQC